MDPAPSRVAEPLLELDVPEELELVVELELELEPHAATPSEAASASASAVIRLLVNVFSFAWMCTRVSV